MTELEELHLAYANLEASLAKAKEQAAVLAKLQAQSDPVQFLANGTRFKTTLLADGSVRITGLPYELAGRWVALIAAENDCHMKLIAPMQAQSEPIAYLAWRDGKPCYEGDDAVCEDAVWPVDGDDDRTSMPVYLHPAPVRQEPIDSEAKASAYMEAKLWEFIDMAAIFPEAQIDRRTWDHVIVYAPVQQEQRK